MLDVSDGLVRDAGRIARASGVGLDLDPALLAGDVAALAPAVGEAEARRCVLTGGEEHSLLACFPAGTALPPGWRPLGRVVTGTGVTVGGVLQGPGGGWDHFGG
jgi:thiamine-monophosphate kinase